MVKGLARRWCCLRHDLLVKCVDVSHFIAKSGYSPVTVRILRTFNEPQVNVPCNVESHAHSKKENPK